MILERDILTKELNKLINFNYFRLLKVKEQKPTLKGLAVI